MVDLRWGSLSECTPELLLSLLEKLEANSLVRLSSTGRWTITALGRQQLLHTAEAPETLRPPLPSSAQPGPSTKSARTVSTVSKEETLPFVNPKSSAGRFGSALGSVSELLPQVRDPGFQLVQQEGKRYLDPSQNDVIHAPVESRQLVEAGSGFGKTDTACARVAWLIQQGVSSTRILLLSFTRTAVREMRARIRELASSGVDVMSGKTSATAGLRKAGARNRFGMSSENWERTSPETGLTSVRSQRDSPKGSFQTS
ncbi:MAG: UvrD-helicase domain-containing protein [Myxococcota bacterium]